MVVLLRCFALVFLVFSIMILTSCAKAAPAFAAA